jgi:hypothetical protein
MANDDLIKRQRWPVIVIVLASLVGAGLIGWLLQPEEPRLRSVGSYQTIAINYKAHHPECQLDALAMLPRQKQKRQISICADEEEQVRIATASLVAAQRQADSANAGVVLAAQQTRIAAWGVVTGVLTLFAAIAAAWYAKQAAKFSKRTLEHDKDVAGLQLRTNVHIETVDVIGKDTANPKVTFGVRNSGTVIARDFRVTGGWGFRKNEEPARLNLSRINMPKQMTFGTALTIPVPPSDVLTALREGNLYCEFEVSWKDQAGERHRIGEIHRFDGEEFRFLTDTTRSDLTLPPLN